MNRAMQALAVTSLVVGGATLATATPASAAISVVTAGTQVNVTATGSTYITFGCDSSNHFQVSGTASAPAISCNVVNRVNITGDAGNQTVLGSMLVDPMFVASPYIVASLGAGTDSISETDLADTIDTGADNDSIFIQSGGSANGTISLGSGTIDVAYFTGSALTESIAATSTTADVSTKFTDTNGSNTRVVKNVDRLVVRGGDGNDKLTAKGVTAASSVTDISLYGDAGGDALSASPKGSTMFGGDGSNSFFGGVGLDQFHSSSDTDEIDSTGGGNDEVFDETNGRSGGRAITAPVATRYYQYQNGCDAQSRVRAGTSGGSRVISSLCRPGLQELPATVSEVQVLASDNKHDQALFDVVVPGSTIVKVRGDADNNDLADITIPSGTWNVLGSAPGTVTIDPTNAGLGTVTLQNTADPSIHLPWTNKNQGFAHRAIRDLLYRFPAAAERDAIRDALTNGSKTRPQVVSSLMDTDEYRGLDVDRVFVRFLHRPADAGGRTYWINGLRNGKSLRKFRAQLFGSNEYFVNSFSSNTTFVRNAYFDVLGRVPDSAGLAYWVNKISTGTGRGSVANAFLASTEARRQIVKDQFLRFALRYPTTAEADEWITKLDGDQGEQQLIAYLASSGAYYNAG